MVLPDAAQDVARLAVIERHRATGRIGNGFVHGFGLREGAFASSVAHDAHNLIVAGIDTGSMHACVERLAAIGGGIVVANGGRVCAELALPVAGLMSPAAPHEVVTAMHSLHAALAELGVQGEAPFMLLAFLGLSVIPALKLTDQGLFDVDRFEPVPTIPAVDAHTV